MKTPIPVNYKKIYMDIITKKFPEKKVIMKFLAGKEELSVLEVIDINKKIFENEDQSDQIFNQKLRSYNTHAILKILDYQKKHQLNNSQLALHFKMSRNTIAKWKKQFL
ncbi:helix-turn-helix domain-containing protein [Chryseobacterium soli]|uniref:helix-turn-helix domain-containing protein n=1 Tax=Chryseobacterium soli TaxID=445961 RepID=UPI002952F190|nr:helix-turn-helix domain-containing protein [Chryseobacterium soli]MDV7695489.1 helix-turn-helix domain-containing protein [Chryseobacterium soli]